MFKRLLIAFLASLLVAQPMTAAAADLNSIFSSLSTGGSTTSVNKPGFYQSGARNVLSGGGLDVRVPYSRKVPDIITLNPPKVVAGCGGVSAYFGGVSFISGKEFEQLLKTIASGAANGFVAHLVLKTLCPACESVAQLMQRLNQAASEMAKKSCEWGAQAADAVKDNMPVGVGDVTCSSMASTLGFSSDYASAADKLCTNAKDSTKEINKYLTPKGGVNCASGAATDDASRKACQEKADAVAKLKAGNATWNVVSKVLRLPSKTGEGEAQGTLLLNLVGTTISGAGADCGDGDGPSEDGKPVTCTKTITPERLTFLMMCGTRFNSSTTQGAQAAMQYCKAYADQADKAAAGTGDKIYVCQTGAAVDELGYPCMRMVKISIADAVAGGEPILQGDGILLQTSRLLTEAVRRVSADEPIYKGPGDVKGEQIIALIQAAPYPLYQAINAAAVYPSAAENMLQTMALLIAQSTVYQYLDQFLSLATASATLPEGGQSVEKIDRAIETIRTSAAAANKTVANNLIINSQLTEQIRQLNVAIQRSVMSGEVLGANKMAETIGASIANAAQGGDGGKAGR